jgi:hypothetical protein
LHPSLREQVGRWLDRDSEKGVKKFDQLSQKYAGEIAQEATKEVLAKFKNSLRNYTSSDLPLDRVS